MSKLTADLKEQVKSLSRANLEKVVLKLAAKDKMVRDYLVINFLDRESGESDLIDEAKSDLNKLFMKSYKGFSDQLQYANMLSACSKRITEFVSVCKNKQMEADLVMHVLDHIFRLHPGLFGTCFTAFDHKIGLLLRRVITIVDKKLHPDYKIEYQDRINKYLQQVHATSSHIHSIHTLPDQI